MNKNLSDGEIIKLSLRLYPEEMQYELREDATKLILAVHGRNPHYKVMFGDMMAYELLWKLGKFLNEQDA